MAAKLHLEPTNRVVDHFRLSRDEFNLEAPYQRGSVWTLTQRQNLIRSILIGIPIGSVVIAKNEHADQYYRIVDGKQRVETILKFVDGEFAVPTYWLDRNVPAMDMKGPSPSDAMAAWPDLTQEQQAVWRRTTIQTVEFDPTKEWLGRDNEGNSKWCERSEEEILTFEAQVYLLINTAGTEHEESDLRTARSLS